MKKTEWQRIIAALESAGKTQREIAKAVGLSPGALNDLAKGRSREPKLDAALRLREMAATVA